MASRAANVTSIDAVAAMKAALLEFATDIEDALVELELEARRPVEWIESDRAMYWPREMRKASDAVSEARIALERCEITISSEERRSCHDERKALEKAKRRLRVTEEKVQAVKKWKIQIRKEVQGFEVELAKMKHYLESDFLRGVAMLERMSQALQRYVQQGGAVPQVMGESTGGEGENLP